jgi:large subunit ribosomal protein L29
MAKASEFRELGTDDIRQRARDLDDQVFRARLQGSMGSTDAANKMRSLRRDRARALTVLRERQLAQAAAAAAPAPEERETSAAE